MDIDFKKFLALTSLMATPLVTASSGCILVTDDGDDDGASTASGTSSGGTGTASAADTGSTSAADGTSAGTGTASGTTGGTAAESGSSGSAGSSSDGTGATGTTGAVDPGTCCEVHLQPGCSNADIEACVCAADTACCDVEIGWDMTCVGLVESENCAVCPE